MFFYYYFRRVQLHFSFLSREWILVEGQAVKSYWDGEGTGRRDTIPLYFIFYFLWIFVIGVSFFSKGASETKNSIDARV